MDDFRSDAMAKAAMDHFSKNGALQGAALAVGTSVAAGAVTVAAIAVPVAVVGGAAYGVYKLWKWLEDA